MRIFEGCRFTDAVIANEDAKFINCEFASGINPKEKGVFGLQILGGANVIVSNCTFNNKGYSAIYMNSTGKIQILNNVIDCTGLYNPIEGASGSNSMKLSDVTIKGNVLNGICGNNYFNFYCYVDGAQFNIEDNIIYGMSQQAEVVRISNLFNQTATFNIKDIAYTYDMSTAFDANWTKFFLFQDYSKDEVQDFTKITINMENIICNSVKVTDKDNFPVGGLLCVYDPNKSADGSTVYLTEINQPTINFN